MVSYMHTQLKIETKQNASKTMFRLRNDLLCVEWDVKLYSLTHIQDYVQIICWNRKNSEYKNDMYSKFYVTHKYKCV